jgi:hypothetical protein
LLIIRKRNPQFPRAVRALPASRLVFKGLVRPDRK